jgi:RND family efflux transporter MFP subunit
MVSPQTEFIGTVFFQEVSDVASELSGLVAHVDFEEGQRVREGEILVRLVSDLLRKRRQSTRADYEQVVANLENARIDYERIETLHKQGAIAEQEYDRNRFLVKALEKRAASLAAAVERIELELKKKGIKAPFDGVVVRKHVDRGEWIAEGDTVATLAKDDVIDIVANVPEKILAYVQKGISVKVEAGGEQLSGEVFAVIPRGDIATRTFPVKVRMPNTRSLMEGMEANIRLPSGKEEKTLMVPRDAVIWLFGETVVFAVIDGKAKRIPVTVTAYEDLQTGVAATDLAPGMKVVVKGNERLRDGQMVSIVDGTGSTGQL